MKEILFIDKGDCVLFLESVVQRTALSYKEFNISQNDFMGNFLERLYVLYFSNSYSVFNEYQCYYKKEFASYKDFLDCHYNLTADELAILNSETLRCSKAKDLMPRSYFLKMKGIKEKLEDYLGGEFED